jgi:hypothetical protein
MVYFALLSRRKDPSELFAAPKVVCLVIQYCKFNFYLLFFKYSFLLFSVLSFSFLLCVSVFIFFFAPAYPIASTFHLPYSFLSALLQFQDKQPFFQNSFIHFPHYFDFLFLTLLYLFSLFASICRRHLMIFLYESKQFPEYNIGHINFNWMLCSCVQCFTANKVNCVTWLSLIANVDR